MNTAQPMKLYTYSRISVFFQSFSYVNMNKNKKKKQMFCAIVAFILSLRICVFIQNTCYASNHSFFSFNIKSSFFFRAMPADFISFFFSIFLFSSFFTVPYTHSVMRLSIYLTKKSKSWKNSMSLEMEMRNNAFPQIFSCDMSCFAWNLFAYSNW